MRKATLYMLSILLLASLGARPLPGQAPGGRDEVVTIQVSPQTLLLNWKARGDVKVTVHAEVSFGLFDGADIDVWLGDIQATYIKPDARGDLVAKFPFDQVAQLLEVGSATLTLTAITRDGTVYTGTDEVRIIEP